MKQRIAYHSLGCKLNFAEASSLSDDFVSHNFMQVPFNQEADVYVINTCSVTETANAKSRKAIKKAIRKNPKAIVIVTGCYAQLKPKEIATIQGVDYIFGTGQKQHIEAIIEDLSKQKSPHFINSDFQTIEGFYPAWSSDRTRSFLKVQDGCDNFCTYCTIPLARGHSRNISIAKISKQASEIAKAGFKEIILTGVNIGDFGKSSGESFYELIKALGEVDGIDRYRISSIEPDLLHHEIIDFVLEHPKFMPHFHIPLQSGSDSMLKLMERKYDTTLFRERINYIRNKNKDAFIGIDLIVGVPGETESLFQESVEFVNSLDVSFVHVFTYSEREGTKALEIKPVIPHSERKKRSKVMHKISELKHHQFYMSQQKQNRPVLFEQSKHQELIFGFTDNYIKVGVPINKNLSNVIKLIKLDELNPKGYFEGKI
ncbi:MAG: tRNA (N(6)-L-threonylcarbamoyladenosine(37)-C(2))-methylthiotransferase MtaB [Bacteroidota bacterium]|nr:tRNA (N(6)-L-threonylcarbamoyladenosine(37)-C(2))-methylthiotransferase MtaB [Bacteroidota bacterium]